MTDTPPPGGMLDRIAAPPTRRAGAAWALFALVMMLIGAVLIPSMFTDDSDQVLLVQWFLGGNVLAFLGFLPLLRAVHALIAERAVPAWSLGVAYAVLLIRPLALVPDIVAAPISVLADLGPLVPYLLLATTGVAAGFAAWAMLPLAQNAASPWRRLAVAAAVGLLVALGLYSFAPFIAPLATLGVGVGLLMGRGAGGHDPANGPAGQH